MKRSILIVGLAVGVSLMLVWGCGKQEEPAKAQKPAEVKKSATEQKPEVKQAPPAPPAAPAQKEAEPQGHQVPKPTGTEAKQGQNPVLNQALLAYLAKKGVDAKFADPHQTALIDLNGDGRMDTLVLLENPLYFCGTGGCTMVVFQGTQAGFQFVSSSSLMRGPVLVSETRTQGWRDLIVEVSGGGMAPKQVALKYAGGKYPPNPSILPPLPKNQPLTGAKVFSGQP